MSLERDTCAPKLIAGVYAPATGWLLAHASASIE